LVAEMKSSENRKTKKKLSESKEGVFTSNVENERLELTEMV